MIKLLQGLDRSLGAPRGSPQGSHGGSSSAAPPVRGREERVRRRPPIESNPKTAIGPRARRTPRTPSAPWRCQRPPSPEGGPLCLPTPSPPWGEGGPSSLPPTSPQELLEGRGAPWGFVCERPPTRGYLDPKADLAAGPPPPLEGADRPVEAPIVLLFPFESLTQNRSISILKQHRIWRDYGRIPSPDIRLPYALRFDSRPQPPSFL